MQSGKNTHLTKNDIWFYQQVYTSDEHLQPASLLNKQEIKEREMNTAIEMSYFAKWIEAGNKNTLISGVGTIGNGKRKPNYLN